MPLWGPPRSGPGVAGRPMRSMIRMRASPAPAASMRERVMPLTKKPPYPLGCTRALSCRSLAETRRSSSKPARTWRPANSPITTPNSVSIANVSAADVIASFQRIGSARRTRPTRSVTGPAPHPLRDRSWSAHYVPGTAHGVQYARLTLGLELAPQVGDEHVDGVGLAERGIAPDLLEQLVARDHQSLVAHHELEELELAGGELEQAIAAGGLVRGRVELQVADDQRRAAPRRAPAQERAQPRQQLLEVERLDQVVVGAGVEPLDARVDRVARGEHQDRHVAVGAQAAGDLDAVDLGQPQVEHDGVGLEHRGLVERLAAVGGEADVVALAAQRPAYDVADVGVVLDDQHSCPVSHRSHVRADSGPAPEI